MNGRLDFVRYALGLSWRLDRRAALASYALLCGLALGSAAVALVLRWVVDSARMGALGVLAVAVAVGALGQAVLTVGSRVQVNLQRDLIEKSALEVEREILILASRTPGTGHLEQPEYLDRVDLLRRSTTAIAGAGWTGAQALTNYVALAATLAVLATANPWLVLLPALAVPSLLLSRRGQDLVHRALRADAETDRVEQRLMSLCTKAESVQEIRAAGAATELDRRIGRLWEEGTRSRSVAQLRAAALSTLGWLPFAAGYVGALLMVVGEATGQGVTNGDVLLVVFLALRVRGQVGSAVDSGNRLGEGLRAAEHLRWLRDVHDTARRGAGTAPAPERLHRGIALRDVSFHYPGTDRPALSDVTLDLPAGSTAALVGPNGAGKTTLVKLLLGMHQPDSGVITVDGTPLSLLEPEAWRLRTSAVFQDFVRFPFPLRHAVGLGGLDRADDDRAVRDALTLAGAGDLAGSLPDGPDTRLGGDFGGQELSGGQWQAVALARGYFRPAPLLLALDEPTASLDPTRERELFTRYGQRARAVAEAVGGVTLLVLHRLAAAKDADVVLFIDGGRVVEQGAHDELVRAGGPYAELYTRQSAAFQSRPTSALGEEVSE